MLYSDIVRIQESDWNEVADVWEASVRATHAFLQEEDILFFKPRIAPYLQETESFCVRNTHGRIAGFIGISDKNIEMLFIHPSERGKGLGKKFIRFAIDRFGADKVDVNEQNEQAFYFYKKMGFEVVGRDEQDGTGKPYPILHMALPKELQRNIEVHPLGFFLPPNTKLLMLGSFPPPRARWSMDFYYPNIINDMWRILGIIFYEDKEYFLETSKAFSREKASSFCREKGIGIGDTAVEIVRLQANASDKFLEVVKPFDPVEVLSRIPDCRAVVVTGQKAMDTFQAVVPQVGEPKIGSYSSFELSGHTYKLFRMPSSSRAYPLSLDKKAAVYRTMFEELQMI